MGATRQPTRQATRQQPTRQPTGGGRRVEVGLDLVFGDVAAPDAPSYWARAVPADRFDRLTQDMHRAIVAEAGLPENSDDALLETVIGEAVETFLSRVGHPVAAALKMGALMRRIGAREAALGRSFDTFDSSLRVARCAAEAYLPRLLAVHPLPDHRVQELRGDLAIFIDQLREHARVGFDRQWSMEEVSPENADLALRRVLFDDKATVGLERLRLLAVHAGRLLPERLVPVVALDAPLPRLHARPNRVVAGFSPHEAYFAEESLAETIAETRELLVADSLLLLGDPTELSQAPRALGLTRRAAGLATASLLPRPEGGILRCSDVLGQIATFADPYLLDLLVAKHLSGFVEMSPQRRVDLGELLLDWLETGEPVNEIARRTGQHTQTLHSRMRALRRILGDVLGDGQQRVELILALRRELPMWQRRVRAA